MPVTDGKQLRLRVTTPCRKLVGGSAQENLWNAIRSLKSFTTAEVAYAATTDVLKVTEAVAERYLGKLRDAGYLTVHHDPASRSKRWRLLPKMNTGAMPPMLVQITLTFDRNRKLVLDGPHAAEVVL